MFPCPPLPLPLHAHPHFRERIQALFVSLGPQRWAARPDHTDFALRTTRALEQSLTAAVGSLTTRPDSPHPPSAELRSCLHMATSLATLIAMITPAAPTDALLLLPKLLSALSCLCSWVAGIHHSIQKRLQHLVAAPAAPSAHDRRAAAAAKEEAAAQLAGVAAQHRVIAGHVCAAVRQLAPAMAAMAADKRLPLQEQRLLSEVLQQPCCPPFQPPALAPGFGLSFRRRWWQRGGRGVSRGSAGGQAHGAAHF